MAYHVTYREGERAHVVVQRYELGEDVIPARDVLAQGARQ
ncbi:hypothetical protein X907_1729 [Glycocaulis alkaliphilus]|uniref:Uncharacterized protein n=2 Tax=Glycocaulis alkaliphilus TaxID=1434191 RepID=A0A3T0EAF6_9PROT|nr:hypothetical protein X907_1729 [Glycocaulis alkaliphilus]